MVRCVMVLVRMKGQGKTAGISLNGMLEIGRPKRRSAFDSADDDSACRNLVISRQLMLGGVFNGFVFAYDEMAGTGEILRDSGTILRDAIMNFDCHGCSRFMAIYISCLTSIAHHCCAATRAFR